MKPTRNGKVFAFVNIIVIALFYKGMDYCGARTGDRNGMTISIAALLTIAILFLAAWLLLRSENQRQRKVNISLAYHLTTVLIAAFGWGIAYALSDYIQPIDLAWIAAVGGGSLLAHWLFTRNRAKGMNSKRAFL